MNQEMNKFSTLEKVIWYQKIKKFSSVGRRI